MRRTVIIITAVIVAAAAPAPAAAKRWAVAAKLCGGSGCLALTDSTLIERVAKASQAENWGLPFEPPEPPPSPFYRVIVDTGSSVDPTWSYLYVPSWGAIRIDNPSDAAPSFWRTAAPSITATLSPLLDRVGPYPPSAEWLGRGSQDDRPSLTPAAFFAIVLGLTALFSATRLAGR